MKRNAHRIAGGLAFLIIAVFWTATVASELMGTAVIIATVKTAILWAMAILIPALMITGGSGFSLARKRRGLLLDRKRRRMPIIAANGILVLLPSAIYLANKAQSGEFDTMFYAVQSLELIVGAVNLTLIGKNIRDGMRMTGRIRRKSSA
jgi:hypothetical protein